MNAFGITFFPFSWAIGKWVKPHKTLFAFGPFRFVGYRAAGSWKEVAVSPRGIDAGDE